MASRDATANIHNPGEPGQRRAVQRRTHPAESKSLPAHLKQELVRQGAESAQAQDPSKQKSKQLKQGDTQDSNGSDESASKWFDKANECGPQGQRESPSTNESPFYLGNQKQYFPNNFVSSGSDDDLFGAEHNADSENEDLRGVIDDLTVENKRLKLLLKSTRSRPSPSSTEAQAHDRLFDLRVHGLNSDKKRELETLLRTFALSIHQNSNAASTSSVACGSALNQSASENPSNDAPQKVRSKPGQIPTDSGYGTNSTSGLTNNAAPTTQPVPYSPKKSRATNIHNYLHDIPDSLLPRQSLYMSKRAKMGLVVRRLENLFTGRIALPGEHDQPLQQQEVSQSAARADDPSHRFGWHEGSREARMLPSDTRINLDAYNPSPPTKKQKSFHDLHDRLMPESMSAAVSRSASPLEDQRPTRPLDLDVHRAQVAVENIQYLRHLGISSPQVLGAMKQSPWIYLNLLISMGQLHTINVTPSFIRHAIRKLSTNFEVSTDGHKIRWCGGTEGTVFSKEEERAMEFGAPSPVASNEEGGHSSKRSKTNSSSNAMNSEEPSSEYKANGLPNSENTKQKASTGATSTNLRTETSAKTKAPGTPFDYKPLVYKGKKYSPAISYLESSESSCSPSNDSSGLVHALKKSNQSRRRTSDNGMITFYSENPFFCTDLSADRTPVNWIPQRKALPWNTLGLPQETIEESPLRHHDACYFTTEFALRPYTGGNNEALLRMSVESIQGAGEDETVPMELPVSGIGGVFPSDNFALDVKIARKSIPPGKDRQLERIPYTGSRKRRRFEFEIDDCDRWDLRPSKLPPPSYVFFKSSTSSEQMDLDDDSDIDDSTSEAAPLNPPPPIFFNQWSTESDYESGDDSSSADMLEMARAADPDRVAAQEREYLINQNLGRRIEGSLAATVGASGTCSSLSNEGDRLEAQEDDASVSSMDVDGSDSGLDDL